MPCDNSVVGHLFKCSTTSMAASTECINNVDCTSLTCKDNALAKCCVSGTCQCVSNPEKNKCLPCSTNGVYVGQHEHCNRVQSILYREFYSIYKADNCYDRSQDTPFIAQVLPV